LEIDVDDDLLYQGDKKNKSRKSREQSGQENQREESQLRDLKTRLQQLLAKPIVARGVSHNFFTRNTQLPDMSGETIDFSQIKK
jgi:hypothetical protein